MGMTIFIPPQLMHLSLKLFALVQHRCLEKQKRVMERNMCGAPLAMNRLILTLEIQRY